MYTLADCRSAIRACQHAKDRAASLAMRNYWSDVEARWAKRARDLERESLKAPAIDVPAEGPVFGQGDFCPPPVRFGHDEYRCQKCNRVWGRDEQRPACS